MSKLFWQVLKSAPVALSASILLANASIAAPEGSNKEVLDRIGEYNSQGNSAGQVTNVFELRDVSPGDWAFEALRSLVERYGCIEGYPDKTYRGRQALTRYEFAAGLNACMNQIERLIAASESVLREDIDKLQRLIQEFESELAALGARVDDLEARVAFLEDHQFSTTTKLRGEAIVSFNGVGPNTEAAYRNNVYNPGTDFKATEGRDTDDEITGSNRVRLALDSSFTGKDTLTSRLEAKNVPNYRSATGTYSTRLGYDGGVDNDVILDQLWYRTPILNDRVKLHVAATGVDFDDIADPKNPYFESSGTGAIGRFARFNPIVYRTGGDTTAGVNFKFNDKFSIDAAYLTGAVDEVIGGRGANDPRDEGGLFNGDYTAAVQVNFDPSERFGVALTYGHSYYPGAQLEDTGLFGKTGSDEAEFPFLISPGTVFRAADGSLQEVGDEGLPVATSVNRFGAQATFKLSERFNIAGWFGAAIAYPEVGYDRNPFGGTNGIPTAILPPGLAGDEALILSGALNVALLDLVKEGSVLGVIFGVPPVNVDRSSPFDFFGGSNDPTYYVEAQYRFPLTENIIITPGAHVVIHPNQNADNDTLYVGTLRTTFKF